MDASPFQIANPCPKACAFTQGPAKRHFCEDCQLHVHNLSAMSPREISKFTETSGGHACIAYVLRRDGTIVTTTWRTRLAAPFRRLGYALAALFATIFPCFLTACKSQSKFYRTGGSWCGTDGLSKDDRNPMMEGVAPTKISPAATAPSRKNSH